MSFLCAYLSILRPPLRTNSSYGENLHFCTFCTTEQAKRGWSCFPHAHEDGASDIAKSDVRGRTLAVSGALRL